MSFMFRSVPRIVCEAGGIAKTGSLMKELGASRVTIVCDPGIVKLGFAQKAQASLEAAGASPFRSFLTSKPTRPKKSSKLPLQAHVTGRQMV